MLRFKTAALFIVICVSVLAFGLVFFNDYFLTSAEMLREDKSCACDAKTEQNASNDDLEHPLRYVHGKYNNQCVDSCKYRYPEALSVSADNNDILVSNVLHNAEFWVAQVPVNSIREVHILFEEFLPGINHVAFQFIFNENAGVTLYKQNGKNQFTVGMQIPSLVVSPEAAPPRGQKYNLWDGLAGNYALMNRAMTFQTYKEMIDELKHPLRKHRAKLSSEEAKRLFSVVILDAPSVVRNQYQLIFNNCATTVIDASLFAKDLLLSKRWDHWDVLDPLRGVPSSSSLGTVRTLHWWQLIDENAPQANLQNF